VGRHEEIVVRIDEGIGYLLLNRPSKANAYSDAMIRQMDEAVDRFTAEAAVKAVVIGSAVAGRFCAGADLTEIRARSKPDAYKIPSLALFDRIENLPQPTVAAICGPAIAGGLELALACDLRLATAESSFALPETELGIIPAAGGTWRLPRIVGQPIARQLILFGRELSGEEAVEVGLADFLVAPDQLMEEARNWALKAAHRDPLATRLAKAALGRSHGSATGREFVEECQSQLYGRVDKEGSE
jgi:enoyl-CoA hydratase/carnithine racemase